MLDQTDRCIPKQLGLLRNLDSAALQLHNDNCFPAIIHYLERIRTIINVSNYITQQGNQMLWREKLFHQGTLFPISWQTPTQTHRTMDLSPRKQLWERAWVLLILVTWDLHQLLKAIPLNKDYTWQVTWEMTKKLLQRWWQLKYAQLYYGKSIPHKPAKWNGLHIAGKYVSKQKWVNGMDPKQGHQQQRSFLHVMGFLCSFVAKNKCITIFFLFWDILQWKRNDAGAVS